MKLQRNNKYKSKIALGLSTLMLSSLLLTGCSNEIEIPKIDDIPAVTQEVVVTSEPVATEMPIVTETPVVTPEPTPEVTETPVELTEEERIELEMEKLGLANPKREIKGESLYCMYFSKDGQDKVLPIEIVMSDNNMVDVIDVFSEVTLIKIPYKAIVSGFESSNSSGSKYLLKDFKGYEVVSPYMDGAENIGINRFWFELYLPAYKNGEISDDDCYSSVIELVDIDLRKGQFIYDPRIHTYTIGDIAEVYAKYIPENYRVTAYDLNPELEVEHTKSIG